MTCFRLQRIAGIVAITTLCAAGAAAQKKPSPSPSPPAEPRVVLPAAVPAVKPKEVSLVRVNVTGQPYDYTRPWQKKAPFSKRALGAVLPKNRVLVTADLVANQNYVELERAESGEKSGAEVTVVDYEANLALVEPTDKKFLDGLTPLQLALDTVVGDRLAALQLEQTGALVVTEGLVTTVQMTRYPAEVGQFLTYRISMSMQYRDNSYTIPLVKNNKLAGLLLRYDPRTQVLDAIPAPIIAHFLKEADGENYRGFPSAGFSFFPTRDPQLRKFAGQSGKPAGVYVISIEPNSAASKAGLQVGDIVTSVGNNEIDQNGNYVDPLYGKIEFTNLISARAFVGDTVPIHLQRDGQAMQLGLVLEHRTAKDYVIPPFNGDQPPPYYVLGGLVFQELSRAYLREWGANWQKEAPQRFVYLDRFQSELFPEGNRRVVVLTQVLPANSTIGYDDFGFLTVQKVNGREVKSLRELADAVKHPLEGGFIKIETEEDPKQLELDANEVTQEAPAVQQNYGLPALERLQ
ncbi:MAG: PDZ domain-containing protein [Verrucomicrobiota bacterium]|nr:PDZ domain-containing protein [Verrucomicrobiota bacterium]